MALSGNFEYEKVGLKSVLCQFWTSLIRDSQNSVLSVEIVIKVNLLALTFFCCRLFVNVVFLRMAIPSPNSQASVIRSSSRNGGSAPCDGAKLRNCHKHRYNGCGGNTDEEHTKDKQRKGECQHNIRL